MAEDYYQTLGVARDASAGRHSKGLSQARRKYHPDMNPDDKIGQGQVSGSAAGVRRVERPQQARAVRPLRQLVRIDGRRTARCAGGPRRQNLEHGRRGRGDRLQPTVWRAVGGGATPAACSATSSASFAAQAVDAAAARPQPARGADVDSRNRRFPSTRPCWAAKRQISLQRPDGHVETLSVKIPAGHRRRQEDSPARQGRTGARRHRRATC